MSAPEEHEITEVLLAGINEWQEIEPQSFSIVDVYDFLCDGQTTLDANGGAGFGFEFSDLETGEEVRGPISSILAVKTSR